MVEVSCGEPVCTKPADNVLYDTKFSCHVAFCDEHVDEWAAKDRMEET